MPLVGEIKMRDLLGQPLLVDNVVVTSIFSRGGCKLKIGVVNELFVSQHKVKVKLYGRNPQVMSLFDYNCFRVNSTFKIKRTVKTSKKDITGKPVSVGDWVITPNALLGSLDLGRINDVHHDGSSFVVSEVNSWYDFQFSCNSCLVVNDHPVLIAYLISR